VGGAAAALATAEKGVGFVAGVLLFDVSATGLASAIGAVIEDCA